jgi:hypothetical protein
MPAMPWRLAPDCTHGLSDMLLEPLATYSRRGFGRASEPTLRVFATTAAMSPMFLVSVSGTMKM